VATAIAALGLVLASAAWINRRYNFTVTPPPIPAANGGGNTMGARTGIAEAVPASSVLLI